jgi:outer membrane protein insertion porin family
MMALAALWLPLLAIPCLLAQSIMQAPPDLPAPVVQTSPNTTPPPPATSATIAPKAQIPSLRAWEGLKVRTIQFNGVEKATLAPLPGLLALQPGMPLDGEKLRDSLRRLYATGLYQTISVDGVRSGDEVTIVFTGTARAFIGAVHVAGVKDDRLASQLIGAAKLAPGTPFSEARLTRGETLIRQQLQENGYYEPVISHTTKPDPEHDLVAVTFNVATGKDARVGAVAVQGESGMSLETFRKKSKLKYNSKVGRDTTSRALTGLRKEYEKQKRLESDVNATSKDYRPAENHLDYQFGVTRGPIVTIEVAGVKLGKGTLKRLIPVYEEGAVDDDLLNEGDRNLRDYYQRAGYFNVKVAHDRKVHTAERSDIIYTVDRGLRHRVASVTVAGNKYFDTDTIVSRLSVLKADIFQKNGLYSQALVTSDIGAITALYQSNGFSDVKVVPEVTDSDTTASGSPAKVGTIAVKYRIDEGVQQRVGKFEIAGNKQVSLQTLSAKLNTQAGQPYSAANVAGDRDEILGYYLDHGFGQAKVNVVQQVDPGNHALVEITMNIDEGDEIFVRQVLISGLEHTRPRTVDQLVTVHSGDPLNQTALLATQRALYNLALFNEVNTAVQNPDGAELQKNVLVQLTEAKRWDFNYGFGFEAQTGNPVNTCLETLISLGIDPSTYKCSPNGNTGVSPAVQFDVTRTNVRGTNQSATLRTAYGTLEQRATLIYSLPKLFGWRRFDGSLSGGYINSQDVTTYASSQLSASVRVTERADRRNTLIYEFSYRRVKVSDVQVAPNLVPLYSQPVRVGGPGVTWIRDTRDNPLDAHRGTYNTVQDFFAKSIFGSQADFNRLDITNSTYYSIGKRKWVIARSTRFGTEQTLGTTTEQTIPLPERLYAGGAQSHRGFGINQAGPRDDETGYPIGGAGAFVNSVELRLPNPVLPYVGDSLGFVLFHDMGNVFNSVSDIAPSFLRFRQPNLSVCKDTSHPPPQTGQLTSGPCNFNYFSHAVGVGLRYRTPIGPIRADFSLNLNPPYYPVYITYYSSSSVPATSPPYHTNSGYFNFFFSIGQSF